MAAQIPVVTAYPAPGHQYPGERRGYYSHAPPTPLQPYHTQQACIIDTADIRYGWRMTRWNSCTDVLLSDAIAAFVPCLPVAQLASSVGVSFVVTLLGFALLYVGGIVSYTVGIASQDPVYEWGSDVSTLLAAWAMYVFGPCATLAAAAWLAFFAELGSVYYYRGVYDDSDISTMAIALVVAHPVAQLIQIVMMVRLTQTHAMRANLPQRLLITICCPTFSLAETVAHAKSHNKVGACHMAPLDELPAYYPEDTAHAWALGRVET